MAEPIIIIKINKYHVKVLKSEVYTLTVHFQSGQYGKDSVVLYIARTQVEKKTRTRLCNDIYIWQFVARCL